MKLTDELLPDSEIMSSQESPNEEEGNFNDFGVDLESISSEEDWDALSLECISSPECWLE